MKIIFAILILLPALALTGDDPEKVLEDKLFGVLDADKDGKVSEKEAETYFLSFDEDKNGDISEAEFADKLEKLDALFTGHEDVLFKLFDRTGDGKANKADIDAVFVLADSNKDNEIEKPEFHAIFLTVLSHVG